MGDSGPNVFTGPPAISAVGLGWPTLTGGVSSGCLLNLVGAEWRWRTTEFQKERTVHWSSSRYITFIYKATVRIMPAPCNGSYQCQVLTTTRDSEYNTAKEVLRTLKILLGIMKRFLKIVEFTQHQKKEVKFKWIDLIILDPKIQGRELETIRSVKEMIE